ADVFDLAVFGLLLGCEATNFLAGLCDPLAQLRALPLTSLAARLEQSFFAEDRAGGAFPRSVARCVREGHALEPVSFGEQSRFPRHVQIELRLDDPEARARQGVVEPHQDLTGLDLTAFPDEDLSDDAAGRVLHLFDAGLDHNSAAGNDCAGDL